MGVPTDQDIQAEMHVAADAPSDKDAQHPMAGQAVSPLTAAQAPPPPRTSSPNFIDSVLQHVDDFGSAYGHWAMRSNQIAMAGLTKGAVAAADSVKSGLEKSGQVMAASEDPEHAQEAFAGADPITPIYNDARNAVLGYRDMLMGGNPSAPEQMLESAWQLVPSFLMFSRVTGAIGGLADLWKGETGFAAALKNGEDFSDAAFGAIKKTAGEAARFAAADAPNAAIMQGPHDPRLADTLQLLRTSEGKFGDLMRAVSPDGSLLGHYIEYLSNHDETEAGGRWKNVLDSFGAGAALTGLMHTAGTVYKQGWNALHFMANEGIDTLSQLGPYPGSPRSQLGHIAFHGTGARPFDQFDPSRIGTGEGNEAFAHGFYFAENQKTGKFYQDMLARRMSSKAFGNDDPQAFALSVLQSPGIQGSRSAAITEISNRIARVERNGASATTDPAAWLEKAHKAVDLIRGGNVGRGRGTLMHVDIPDEHVKNMFDWDAPANEQPGLKKIFDDMQIELAPRGTSTRLMIDGKPARLFADRRAAEETANELLSVSSSGVNGSVAYNRLADVFGSKKAASEYLSDKGVPGTKFWDQFSREEGKGTRNFVVFPKHAKDVKVMKAEE
jgi:hypothetical protein